MTLRLNSTGGGYIEIDAPNTGSNFSVTMPALAGDVVVADASGDIETTTTGTGGSSGKAKVVGYQQGIWTPVSQVGASSLKGRWTRVGDFVTLHFAIDYGTTTGGSVEEISGFPYTGLSTGDEKTDRGTGFCAYTTFPDGAGCLMKATTLDAWQFRALSTGNNVTYSQCSGRAFRGTFFFTTGDTTWTPANGATVS